MKSKRQTILYLLSDLIAVVSAWLLFGGYCYNHFVESWHLLSYPSFMLSPLLFKGGVWVLLSTLFLHVMSGYYNAPFFKSRSGELLTTVATVGLSAILLLFAMLLTNEIQFVAKADKLSFIFFFFLFCCTYLGRWLITRHATKMIHSRKWHNNALVVGCGPRANRLSHTINTMPKSMGWNIVAMVAPPNEELPTDAVSLPLYPFEQLQMVIDQYQIKEMVVALDTDNKETLYQLLNQLFHFDLPISVRPSKKELTFTHLMMNNIYAAPLLQITGSPISECAKNVKRLVDFVASLLALVVLSPTLLVIALLVKLSSRGSILYKQERIGYRHKPFTMYKFRTMYLDAEEEHSPQLSKPNDKRITPVGRCLRKYRLDELPQFWNVLRGDMALVGPRPERQYYIQKIMEVAPHYILLHQLRPGITSWGMVNFGYASSVKEMVKRLEWDMLYLKNRSLLVDLKIIIYTVKTVFTGRGV